MEKRDNNGFSMKEFIQGLVVGILIGFIVCFAIIG